MSSQHQQDAHPTADEADSADQTPDPVPDGESVAHAAEVSSKARSVLDSIDEILAEADEVLLSTLGFEPGEEVDPAEMEARIQRMVDEFEQKGGQ